MQNPPLKTVRLTFRLGLQCHVFHAKDDFYIQRRKSGRARSARSPSRCTPSWTFTRDAITASRCRREDEIAPSLSLLGASSQIRLAKLRIHSFISCLALGMGCSQIMEGKGQCCLGRFTISRSSSTVRSRPQAAALILPQAHLVLQQPLMPPLPRPPLTQKSNRTMMSTKKRTYQTLS